MKKTLIRTSIAATLLTAFTFTSCKKDTSTTPAVSAGDATKAVAYYDSTVTFSSFKTIAIVDSATAINAATATTELMPSEILYRQTMIDSLTARGFSFVSKTASPDLVLNITRVASTSSGLLDAPGFWSNYATFYNPGLYNEAGFPYSVNMNTTQSIGDGLLSFELLDLKDAAAKAAIPIVWEGSISGYTLLTDTTAEKAESGYLLADALYLKAH
jgi:hypothetical protein